MWLQTPFNIPNNNQIVWVRIDRWSGAPFLAKWNSQKQEFLSNDNSIIYPVWVISVWKAQ